MNTCSLVNFLRVVWIVAILWYELAAFSYQVSQCPWPVIPRNDPVETDPHAYHAPTHVLLIADTQVLDHRSYPDRPAWLMWLSQRMVDLNMRKSWWATKQLHPDVIIFLGDMMDGGRYAMSDDEYESYLRRTKDMFAIDESTPVYYLTGNHDVGIGSSDEWSKFARDRWLSHFGPLQQRLKIANHTLVLLDAPGLVEEERKRVVSGMSFPRWTAANPNGPIAFAQQSAEVVHSERHPTVLLTHIPLFRPRDMSCGPLREHGTIREGSGYGYQNTLDYLVSNMLLEGIRPSVIFSGDDHDYCEVRHPIRPSDDIPLSELHSVKEVSVKSFSMAMGIRRPGYQLLSLVPPSSASPSGPTISDVPCFLPDQLGTYIFIYGSLGAVSLLVLLAYHVFHVHASSFQKSSILALLTLRRTLSPSVDMEQVRSSVLQSPDHSPSASQVLRTYDDEPDVTGEADFMLPPPTPGIVVTAKRKNTYPSPLKLRFNVGGQKLVADFSSVRDLLYGCCGKGGTHVVGKGGRRTGLLRAFLGDVVAVAWLPVTLFLAVAWWFL
ncbi:Metallo-dependent phosphatase-like protein [Cytidiella melzeri]|nr:Metallo-dependent phosphatase-like protein [Cytidiella melzeri]